MYIRVSGEEKCAVKKIVIKLFEPQTVGGLWTLLLRGRRNAIVRKKLVKKEGKMRQQTAEDTSGSGRWFNHLWQVGVKIRGRD